MIYNQDYFEVFEAEFIIEECANNPGNRKFENKL